MYYHEVKYLWGTTAITNLWATPHIWVVLSSDSEEDKATLTWFFAYFIFPFIISALVIVLLFLHKTRFNNSAGIPSDTRQNAILSVLHNQRYPRTFTLNFNIITLVLFSFTWLSQRPRHLRPSQPPKRAPHVKPEWCFLLPMWSSNPLPAN